MVQFKKRCIQVSLLVQLSVLFIFVCGISAQNDAESPKKRIFVFVARDSSLAQEKDLDKVESLVAERISAISGTTSFRFGSDQEGLRRDFSSAVRQGKYEGLPAQIHQAFPDADLDGIFYVSLTRDPQFDGQGYISYFYYDAIKRKRDFKFMEKSVSMREMTVMDRLLEVLDKPLGTSEAVVDIYKPVSICFLVDNSGSMIENDNDYNSKDLFFNPMQTARANAIRMVMNKLVVNDEFSFVFFSSTVDTFSPHFLRIRDRKQVQSISRRITDRIAMQPGTDISEAFRKARDIIPQSQLSNVYIILLSDGNPTEGITDLQQLRRFAKDSFPSIPFFVIGLEGDQTKKGYRLEKTFLRNLAYDSGGSFHIIKIKDSAQNRYAETSMAVDAIFNIIRKEQTILNDERPVSQQKVGDRIVYSWEFNINSDTSEFTILIDPFDQGYVVEITDPKGNLLPKAHVELVQLARSASCKISYPNCKGQWKLNVKVPQ